MIVFVQFIYYLVFLIQVFVYKLYAVEEFYLIEVFLSDFRSWMKCFCFFFSSLMNDGLNFGNIGIFSIIFIAVFFFSTGVRKGWYEYVIQDLRSYLVYKLYVFILFIIYMRQEYFVVGDSLIVLRFYICLIEFLSVFSSLGVNIISI